jgi:hypothetical protein
MSKLHKKISISLLVISMLLVSSIGALAAESFTLVGELDISGTAPDFIYQVGTQVFVFDPLAVCTDAAGLPMLCTALVDEALVEVVGTFEGTVYTATAVAVLTVVEGEVTAMDPDPLTLDGTLVLNTEGVTLPEFYTIGDTLEVTYKVVVTPTETENVAVAVEFVSSGLNSVYIYPGDIVSIGAAEWVVGAHTFIVDSATTLPEFYAVNDSVLVTFTMTAEGFLASDITLVASHPDSRYEFGGELIAFTDDIWTVFNEGKGKTHDFVMTEVDLPIYFNIGDMVDLTFRMVQVDGNWIFMVTDLTLTTTVDPKVESNRCLNVREHPGVRKISEDESVPYTEVWNLFCKGFGLGEIKLAFRYSKGSEYTPEMLLDLRAMGYSWGELKKMAQGNIPPEGYEDGEEGEEDVHPGLGKNKEKGTPPGLEKKAVDPVAPESEEVTDGPGNSENAPGQNKDKDKDKDKNKNK